MPRWRRRLDTPHLSKHCQFDACSGHSATPDNLELMHSSDYHYDSNDLSNLTPLGSPMLRIRISGDHQNHARPGVPTAPPINVFNTQSLFLPVVPSLAHKDPVPKDVKHMAKSRLQLPLPRQLLSLLDPVAIDIDETPCGPQKPCQWNGRHPNHHRVSRPHGIPRLDYGLPRDFGKST